MPIVSSLIVFIARSSGAWTTIPAHGSAKPSENGGAPLDFRRKGLRKRPIFTGPISAGLSAGSETSACSIS